MNEKKMTRDRDTRFTPLRVGDKMTSKTGPYIVTWAGPIEHYNNGLSMGMRYDDGYAQDYIAVPYIPTPDEERNRTLASLEHQMEILMLPPDDDRDYPRIVAQRTELARQITELKERGKKNKGGKIISVQQHTCTRCGHVWVQRGHDKPGTCPNSRCRSPYWDRQRTKKGL